MPDSGDITALLREWKDGRQGAFDRLLPLVYPDLRRIAQGYLQRERPDHTLQATELVHELYFRLCRQRDPDWQDRGHFFTFTAKIMRMILIDHSRRHSRDKRGGQRQAVPLSDQFPWVDVASPAYMDLDIALDELEKIDARKARIVEFCYMLGCTTEEAAGLLEISVATAERDLKFARGWLFSRLRPRQPIE